MIVIAWICLICAIGPAILYLWNSFLFQEPPHIQPKPIISNNNIEYTIAQRIGISQSPISVLVPARNEEYGIAACLESVLASRNVELEVIVLDDHSTDCTAEIVRKMASSDSRLRLEHAPQLPANWCGKQHSCYALSKLAQFEVLTFLDADVRLHPDALARMLLFLQQSKAEIVSGFPRQETGTFLEKLVLPLINWLLLCWLPFGLMRHYCWSALGAGCGQWFMTNRTTYEAIEGHAAIKSSLHDGITLPRAFRNKGYMSDICDATQLATCRMYRSASGVWNGLAKNAREGMANTGQIGFWTTILFFGQILPFILLAIIASNNITQDRTEDNASTPFHTNTLFLASATVALAWMPRLHAAWRFRQSLLGAILHPIGIATLLAIQWYSVYRALVGQPVGWKDRPAPRLS